MTDEERRKIALELLNSKLQNVGYGSFRDLEDGTYDVIISQVYSSTNANDKEFYGIKSTIESGDYAGDFILECIYFNDDAFERGVQRIRNILGYFGLADLTENDIDNNNYLERLSEIKGKTAKITIAYDEDVKIYEYQPR